MEESKYRKTRVPPRQCLPREEYQDIEIELVAPPELKGEAKED